MKPQVLARRVLDRIREPSEASIVDRLHAFLSDPANPHTPNGRRILELLEIARQRKVAHEGP
jgi:hypothetical protein